MNPPFNEDDDPLGLGPVDEEIARRREAEEGAGDGSPKFADPLEEIRESDPEFARYLERIDGDPTDWDRPIEFLERSGIHMPPADSLDDAALNEKLWQVIWALADLGCYLEWTDHLSDRELYEKLRTDALCTPTVLMPGSLDYACHLEMAGEEDNAWLRFFADDIARQRIEEDFPDDPLPPKEKPRYDRDKDLPKRPIPLFMSGDEDEDFDGESDSSPDAEPGGENPSHPPNN